MRCEIEECLFVTEKMNNYEEDDRIMTRHLRAHTVKELVSIHALLSNALRGRTEPILSDWMGGAGPVATPVPGGPLTGSTGPQGGVESGIRPMRQKGTG